MEKTNKPKQKTSSPGKLMTLTVIHKHPRVLLGMKKRGFGAGRWNGFGGKVKEGETVESAALREIEEETGLKIGRDSLTKQGIIVFEFEDGNPTLEVHVFKARDIRGEPVETEEMRPQWFGIDEIPFGEMWPDDPYWFAYFLKDKRFRARFRFDKPSSADYASKILEKEIGEAVEL